MNPKVSEAELQAKPSLRAATAAGRVHVSQGQMEMTATPTTDNTLESGNLCWLCAHVSSTVGG
jgi:hypothetical protein